MGQQFCGSCGIELTAGKAVTEVPQAAPAGNRLNMFPVLTVELMNLEQLQDKLGNDAQVSRLTRDLMIRMESQLASQGATIESIRNNVMFLSFQQGNTLAETLSKALKVAIALAKKVIQLQEINLQLRVGLDVANVVEKSPMDAVPERLVAKPGQVVVSHSVYKITGRQVPYEAIGPIKVQGEMQTFFRIVMDVQGEAPIVSTPAPAEQPSPVKAQAPAPLAEPAAPPQPVSTPAAQALPPVVEERKLALDRKFEPVESPGSILYQAPTYTTIQPTGKKGNLGYQQVIGALQTEFQESLSNKTAKGKVLAICAPEGYGKTSVIGLAMSQLPQEGFFWVGGNFYEMYANNQFPLFYGLELALNNLGLSMDGYPADKASEHLQNVLKSMFGNTYTPDKLDFMKTLLSLNPVEPISPAFREQLGRVIPQFADFLKAMAKVKPLIMIMENLDYADAASLELLMQLLHHELMESPITLVLTYTPNVAFTGPLQQVLSLQPFKEYLLGPCDEETLVSMAEAPLAVPWKKLPDTLRAQIIEKGSPMFLEEAFRWLLQKGGFSINPKTGKFSPEKKIKDCQVPEDLRQIIQERLESLEEICRSVLQIASVLGERFSTKMLADLTPATEHFEDVLKFLWQAGFVLPDTGSMARFRHPLIWRIVYQGLEDTMRVKLHQLVADYIAQGRSRSLCFSPALLANHLQRADNLERAVPVWNETGVWLAEVGSVTGANIVFANMQTLMQALPQEQSPMAQKRLYESLAILNLDMLPEYAKNLLLKAMAFDGEKEPAEQLQLQIFLAQAYDRLGSYPHATSTLHRAFQQLPAQANIPERVALGSEEVWFLHIQGKYQEAVMVYQDEVLPSLNQMSTSPMADAALRQSYLRGQLARIRAALFQCDASAFDLIDELIPQCEFHHEQAMAIHLRLARSLGFLMKGNLDGCQREMEPLLNEIDSLPNSPDLMAWWGLIVLMYHCEMGDWQNATMLLPNASYQAEQARDYLTWCMCQALAGRITMANGNYSEAQKLLEQAVTLSAEYHLSHPALMGWRYIAENETTMNNAEVAEQICLRALDVSQKPNTQNRYEFFQLTITHAKIMIALKKFKEAGALLEKHWPALVKSGYTPLVAEAAYQIADLYGHLSQEGLPEPHRAKFLAQRENFLQKAKMLWQEQGNTYRLSLIHQKDNLAVS